MSNEKNGQQHTNQTKLSLEFTDEVYSAAELEAAFLPSDDEMVNSIPRFIPPAPDRSHAYSATTETIGHHLEGARRAIRAAESAPHLAHSPALATPVLGKLWGKIRGQMHELVLFYVNRSNVTHSRVDGQLIEAIDGLTQLVEQQQVEIDSLKKRLAASEDEV